MSIIGCATVLENALKEWQHVTLSRRVDTFNVPSPSSHYRPPYVYAWTTFFFFQLYCIHPQSMQSLKHRRIQRRSIGGGNTLECGQVQGLVGVCYFHLSWSNEGTQHPSVKQLVRQILQRPCKWRCFHNGVDSYKVKCSGGKCVQLEKNVQKSPHDWTLFPFHLFDFRFYRFSHSQHVDWVSESAIDELLILLFFVNLNVQIALLGIGKPFSCVMSNSVCRNVMVSVVYEENQKCCHCFFKSRLVRHNKTCKLVRQSQKLELLEV